MNYEATKVWIDAAQFLWMIAATIWAFWGNKAKETNARIDGIEKKTVDHDKWLTRVNEQVKHLPTNAELEELVGDVKALKAGMDGMRDALKGITRQLELINEYLLERKP